MQNPKEWHQAHELRSTEVFWSLLMFSSTSLPWVECCPLSQAVGLPYDSHEAAEVNCGTNCMSPSAQPVCYGDQSPGMSNLRM